MSITLDELLSQEASTPAGVALAAHGFRPVHQGGGLISFEGVAHGRRVRIIEDLEGGGYGPSMLIQPVVVVDVATDEEQSFPSLSDFLDTLSPTVRVLKLNRKACGMFVQSIRFREFMWKIARLESARTGQPVVFEAGLSGLRLRSLSPGGK